MSCTPGRPCGEHAPTLQPPTPAPGLPRPDRAIGTFHDFLAALIRDVEQSRPVPGAPVLGRDWDIEGDPAALPLARLWAYVADGVAAYTSLTTAEAFIGTAADWRDLRRIAALVGFRPRPRVAARGWAVALTDRGASPLVPAGTRLQSPAVPGRDAQTFEVEGDTQLRSDWAGLTVTPVPRPALPTGRSMRFLREPGFRPGDRVLFVAERGADVPVLPTGFDWFDYWLWLLRLLGLAQTPRSRPVAVAVVEERAEDLGTVVVTFDRDLEELLSPETTPFAAYRVLATAGGARRLTDLVHLSATGSATNVPLGDQFYDKPGDVPLSARHLVLDTALEELSAQRTVALVDWQSDACDILRADRHTPVDWRAAPGTRTRASRLEFAADVATLRGAQVTGRPVTAYVVDRRVVARTHEIPDRIGAQGPARVRVFPAPGPVPSRIAVRTGPADADWRVYACTAAADQEAPEEQVPEGPSADPPLPGGLVLDLTVAAGDPVRGAPLGRAPASANLLAFRHGSTESGTLGSGDAALPGQELAVARPPVAHDVAADGGIVSSLEVRVGGVRWRELPSLFGAGDAEAYVSLLDADGSVRVRFGDGTSGARLPTGRGNVTSTHRTGGGTAGEVPSGAIDTLLGRVPGVTGVRGAGPASGGADQDDERRIARLAPGRARAFGRAVSRADLADLALAFPGVSHATGWRGAGPPGCACGGTGEHVAFLRLAADGRPKAPAEDELRALAAFLDAGRDVTVPLCVTAAVVRGIPLSCGVSVDPRRVPAEVTAAVRAALTARGGPLDPLERPLGRALDRSDVLAVVHGVPGVLGVAGPVLQVGTESPARVLAERHELVVPAEEFTIRVEQP
ncbi:baseplate J/gp47 family protein [Streptomyces sp. NPDC021622]|uniref:baseplate J/gp47 family protein n=1 Tax=Streptomyces sp. NPDC021622 TaxID=3155013 RepID=UPI0033CAE2E5